jgi:hypothetical protein
MKLFASGRGLLPLIRVRQTAGASKSGITRLPVSSPPVRPRVPAPRRKVGLSWLGVRAMKIIAHGSKPGRPRGLIRAWPVWENIAEKLWPSMEIPDAPHGVLRIRLKAYRGRPLTLPDGLKIERGVRVGELHLDNELAFDLVVGRRLNPYHVCRDELRGLAAFVQQDSLGAQVQAFFGRTMVAIAGPRVGFTIRELRHGVWLWFQWLFMIGLLLLYTEGGLERLTRGTTMVSYPREVWMSRDRLLKLYGEHEEHPLHLSSALNDVEKLARTPAALNPGRLYDESSDNSRDEI